VNRLFIEKNYVISALSLANAEMIRHLDLLRGGLRIAISTIRKMKHGQKVDAAAVLRRLALIRAEAKEVRDDATDRMP
jgi:hypothetical protein